MSRTIFEAYNDTKKKLEKAGIEDFVFEAKQIIKHITGLSNLEIINNYTKPLTEVQENKLTAILRQREIHYPLQYILGVWEFYGCKFKVGPGVLIPRSDTETLIDVALRIIEDKKEAKVLDLCSGSGCIGITLAKKRRDISVTLLEKYDEAISYIEKNRALNVALNTRILKGDVLKGEGNDMKYDLIVSNPPYITEEEMKELQTEVTFEPETALAGGKDGLDFYRAIAKNYKPLLNCGGTLALEIGCNQAAAVTGILEKEGYKNIKTEKDIEERQRVVFGTVD